MRPVMLVSALVLILAVSAGTAAVPQTMSYQGVLRDSGGAPVADGVYSVMFSLYDVATGGTALWSESLPVSAEDGIINAILGGTSALALPFDEQYWLGISVEGELELSPRTVLTSVPYALNGASDDGDWSISGSNVYRSIGNVGIGTASPLSRIDVHASGAAESRSHFTNDSTGSTASDGLGLGVSSGGQPYILSYEPSLVLGAGGGTIMAVYPSSVLINGPTAIYGGLSVWGFDMDVGAADGYVLTADASGNGTWLPPAGGGDDGDWTISGANIYRATGNVGIGTATPGAELHVDGDVFVPYTGAYAVGSYAYDGLSWDSGSGSVALGNGITSLAMFAGAAQPRAVLWETGDLGIGLSYTGTPIGRVHVETDQSHAIYSECTHTTLADFAAIKGRSVPTDYYGIGADFQGGYMGVQGTVAPSGSNMYYGGYFQVYGGSGTNHGVYGYATGTGTNYAVYGLKGDGGDYAGYFYGNVYSTGTITAALARSRIDHPLDPENMYLNHNAVESPEMKTIYDGSVVLGADGSAWVEMPEWFDALNAELRYQLTCVGGHAPVYVAEEVRDNRFRIAGGTPGLKVCWQVTGVRKDAFAQAHSVSVEEMKPVDEQGLYLHPTARGFSQEMSPDYQRRLEMERKMALANQGN